MLWAVTAILAIGGSAASSSPWQAAEFLYQEQKKPIIIEYFSPSAPSLRRSKEEKPLARAQEYARVLERDLRWKEDYAAYPCKWLPVDLRHFDSLKEWSDREGEPNGKAVQKRGNTWSIKLLPGESLSLQSLRGLGVVDFDGSVPWFLKYRFVIRAESASSDTLLRAICDCLGADIVTKGERQTLAIDAEAFRGRRLQHASEQMRRVPPPFPMSFASANELDYLSSKIEALVLGRLSLQQTIRLYSDTSNSYEISTSRNPELNKALLALLSLSNRSLPRGVKPPALQVGAPMRAVIRGDGHVGGVAIMENGLPLHF